MDAKDTELDLIVTTSRKPERFINFLNQLHIALNSGLRTRITMAMSGDFPEVESVLRQDEKDRIRFVKDAPDGEVGHKALIHVLHGMDFCDWVGIFNDDDCILPWGLRHLWEARDGVSMVVGQALGVSRGKHYDFSNWKLGPSITYCHITAAQVIFNMRALETLPKPWWDEIRTGDYNFVKRMSDHFPFRIIPSVVNVMAFAELENLGHEFGRQFHDLYGAIL